MFHDGIDLPDFAAFPLLDSEQGRANLAVMIPRTSTWQSAWARASWWTLPRGERTWTGAPDSGTTPSDLQASTTPVEFVSHLARQRPALASVVNGVVGPRGDGYVVGATMSAPEAAAYHGLQARSFAEAGAAMMSAITMTYAEEGIGIAVPLPPSVCRSSFRSRSRPMGDCRRGKSAG